MNKLTIEQRVARLERMLSNKRSCNEAAKRLPNGAVANKVCDVVAALTGRSRMDKVRAVDDLEDMGILDNVVSRGNEWSNIRDVKDAIISCWDDQIGMEGRGAAQFFIGTFGGKTRCSLTLQPIYGGDLTIKFNWPDEF
jgi:hypothetical protein